MTATMTSHWTMILSPTHLDILTSLKYLGKDI